MSNVSVSIYIKGKEYENFWKKFPNYNLGIEFDDDPEGDSAVGDINFGFELKDIFSYSQEEKIIVESYFDKMFADNPSLDFMVFVCKSDSVYVYEPCLRWISYKGECVRFSSTFPSDEDDFAGGDVFESWEKGCVKAWRNYEGSEFDDLIDSFYNI